MKYTSLKKQHIREQQHLYFLKLLKNLSLKILKNKIAINFK